MLWIHRFNFTIGMQRSCDFLVEVTAHIYLLNTIFLDFFHLYCKICYNGGFVQVFRAFYTKWMMSLPIIHSGQTNE
jgi:hypothetical protein